MRILQKAIETLSRAAYIGANRLLAAVSHAVTREVSAVLPQTPILILGPPRSGTTLLYQLLVARFEVAYLTNIHDLFFGVPSLIERCVQSGTRQSGTDYCSQFGVTRGAMGPSECGEFWYRFFPRDPQVVELGGVTPSRMTAMRSVIAQFGRAARRPIVFKNVVNCVRLGPIAEAIPEALFIRIDRDVAENAISLLKCRQRRCGSIDHWWSVRPPKYENIQSRPPAEQVVEQIWRTQEAADRNLANIPESRILRLTYASLCQAPRKTMDEVGTFLAANGIRCNVRAEIPKEFSTVSLASKHPDWAALVRQYIIQAERKREIDQ
jgi:hypothetical protein